MQPRACRNQGRTRAPWFGRWRGETVVCVASGPSLADDQVQHVRQAQEEGKCRVIVVNDNWRLIPAADVLYACDYRWWHRYHAAVIGGERWTMDRRAAGEFGLRHIEGVAGEGLCRAPGRLFHGSNSGYQAVGLAWQFGARRIVLLGYDMQHSGGKAHWFGDHPKGFPNAPAVGRWAAKFPALARDLQRLGVEVINCSTETALQCFRRDSIAEVL